MTRRITMHRDIPTALQWPNATWADMQTEMYGAAKSLLFPGLVWGGMSTDTAIFVQSALADFDELTAQSFGRWRIFSKLGAGYSSDRSVGEVVTSVYTCLPMLDEEGEPVPNKGLEFIITARGSMPEDPDVSKAEKAVFLGVQAAIAKVRSAL